jgi:RecA-family ATPase
MDDFSHIADRLRQFADSAPVYEPPHDAPSPRTGNGHTHANDLLARLPKRLDLVALDETEPEPPAFIIRDWLPAGYATMLAGHGGVGKSYCALFMAVCIAAGKPWMGQGTERRRVVYLSCEDRANVLHWRLKRTCDYLGIDLASLAEWLEVYDLVGHDTITFKGGDAPLTATYSAIQNHVRRNDVLFIDGVSDTFGGNENDRAQVKAFVNSLLALIGADDGAVVLIAHVNKPTAQTNGTSEGYSGSTQWHNAVRARMYLHPELQTDPDDGQVEKTGKLLLDLQKSNLGTADQQIKLIWDDRGKLFCPDGDVGQGEHWLDRKQRDNHAKEVFLRLLDKTNAQNRPVSPKSRAANYAPKALAKMPGHNGLSKVDFERAMERLFEAQEIQVTDYRDESRHVRQCIERIQ